MNLDFKEILNLFNEEKVEYLIVGGYAVIEYTEPRYTKDLDIWINAESENARRVFSALQRFGAPLSTVTVEDFTNPGLVYQMGRPPARIDIIMRAKGLEFNDCWLNRVESNYDEVQVNFISLRDLIDNKLAVGRPQDLIDAENLLLSAKQKGE